ncbi:MAG: DoxX family membrane protein [Marinilabiliaceae bacterium]
MANITKVEWLKKTDTIIRSWMQKNGLFLLRISVGLIFFWFGVLKFFPGVSPAHDLAIRTISVMSFGLLPEFIISNGLALWEVLIGLGLIAGKYLRITLVLLFLQMIGTFFPVFLFPQEVFAKVPFVPTLEGQYIIKNLIIVSAGFVIGGNLKKHPL